MFTSSLFLACPLNEPLLFALKKAPPSEVELFVQPSPSPYLEKIYYQGMPYLAKPLSPLVSTEELEATAFHLISLLGKLAPELSFSLRSLSLVVVES